jgi:hypothetical protein
MVLIDAPASFWNPLATVIIARACGNVDMECRLHSLKFCLWLFDEDVIQGMREYDPRPWRLLATSVIWSTVIKDILEMIHGSVQDSFRIEAETYGIEGEPRLFFCEYSDLMWRELSETIFGKAGKISESVRSIHRIIKEGEKWPV